MCVSGCVCVCVMWSSEVLSYRNMTSVERCGTFLTPGLCGVCGFWTAGMCVIAATCVSCCFLMSECDCVCMEHNFVETCIVFCVCLREFVCLWNTLSLRRCSPCVDRRNKDCVLPCRFLLLQTSDSCKQMVDCRWVRSQWRVRRRRGLR